MGKVNKEVLTSVAFIAARKADGNYKFEGSVFFISWEQYATNPNLSKCVYWATAKHVIDKIKAYGCQEVHIRLNDKDGGSRWVKTKVSSWYCDPSDNLCDIAILRRDLPNWADHTAIPRHYFLTDEIMSKFEFDITDDVIVVGLFHRRVGNRRNVPIVRSGAIASINDDELVSTRLGEMRAYLIECRSIGGLSGSPVIVISDSDHHWKLKLQKGDSTMFLMGLIHGHFDLKSDSIDALGSAKDRDPENINTGIAVVTPVSRLTKLINDYHATNPAPDDLKIPFSFAPVEPLAPRISGTQSGIDISITKKSETDD